MPIRFESPSLGGRGDTYLDPTGWQAGISFRRLTAGDFVVGRDQHDELGPFGQPIDFAIQSFTLSLSHAVTERVTLSLHMPWSTGKATRLYPDGKRHTSSASGLGDIHLVATRWMSDP